MTAVGDEATWESQGNDLIRYDGFDNGGGKSVLWLSSAMMTAFIFVLSRQRNPWWMQLQNPRTEQSNSRRYLHGSLRIASHLAWCHMKCRGDADAVKLSISVSAKPSPCRVIQHGYRYGCTKVTLSELPDDP